MLKKIESSTMKKPLTILLGVYVCLFISYSTHHEERLTTNSSAAKSKVNKLTLTPGQSIAQDSVQTKNECDDSGELVSRKVLSTDISAGDIFIGNE